MNQLPVAAARIHVPRFVADVASLMTSRVFVMALTFLCGVITARTLGPESKGAVIALLVVPGLIQSFAELGLRQSTAYFLGKQIFADQSVISTIALLALIISVAGMVIVAGLYLISGLPQKYGWNTTVIALLMLPSSLVMSYGSGVLMAKQRIRAIAGVSVLEPLVVLGLLVFLLVSGLVNIQSVLLVTVLGSVVAAFSTVVLVHPYGSIRPKYIPGLPLRFVKMGVVYAAALFILSLGYRFDIVLLERLSTSQEVGIYSVGVGLAQLLWLLPAALTTVNFARSTTARNVTEHAQKTAMIMRITLWGSLLPCMLLYFLAPWLVPAIYGDAYAKSSDVIQAIMLGIWMALIFKVLNSDLAGRGKPQTALWVYALALLINVVLNLLWIPIFGCIGAAWASSVSYTFGALLFAFTYARMSGLTLADLLIPRRVDFYVLKNSLHI